MRPDIGSEIGLDPLNDRKGGRNSENLDVVVTGIIEGYTIPIVRDDVVACDVVAA